MHPPESPRLTTAYYIPMIGIQKWMSVEHPMSYCLKEWTPLILEFHKGKSGVTRFCILTPANVSCPKSVCYKFSIIRALYKNVSIELWFNAISFCGIEKCLLDILGQRFSVSIIQKNFISIQVFLTCFKFFFLYNQQALFLQRVIFLLEKRREKSGKKDCQFYYSLLILQD